MMPAHNPNPHDDDKGGIPSVTHKSAEDPRPHKLLARVQPLHNRLRRIAKAYEKKEHVDGRLFQDLLRLARDGLNALQDVRDQFPAISLYDDGMFWYELFEYTNASCGRIWQGHDDVTLPANVKENLALILVEVSWFSTATGGDIEKRNGEALASTLLAFADEDLEVKVRRKARSMRAQRVIRFMTRTCDTVAQYRRG
jgi:hypothetical protein